MSNLESISPESPVVPSGGPAASAKHFIGRHAVKLIASLVITFSLIYTLHKGGLKLWPDQANFRNVKVWTFPIYFIMLTIMGYYRAIRWRYLLRSFVDIPTKRILAVSWIGFAAILLLPFRLGEIVRPFMIREKGRVSATAATGTVLAERVVDGLYLSIILAVALLTVPTLHPLPSKVIGLPISVQQVRTSGFVMLGVFTTAFAVIAVFYVARAWAHRMTLAVFGPVSKTLAEKLAVQAEKLAGGLHFLGRFRDAGPFFVESTLYWGFNVLSMWVLAWGCGVVHSDGSPIVFGEACAIMGMLGVTVLIPGPPGLLGVFQAGIYAGMTMYFPTEIVVGPGAAYVFLLYAFQLIWHILAAAFFLVGNRSAWRALQQAEAS